MEWLFQTMSKGDKERNVTQRSQFDTDDARIEATLIREAHQNSLDARPKGISGPVRTRIHLIKPAPNPAFFSGLFAELVPHLASSDIDLSEIDLENPSFLVIEDFGTTGLTGRWDDWEDTPFTDFWRREGKSHKGGASNGRWGLGKLVFSASSRIRTFFGLTVRHDDPGHPLLMGEAVLSIHSFDGKKFQPYGSYANSGDDGIQLPETSLQAVETFRSLCGITRTTEPGLSIVIPFPIEALEMPSLLEGVARNYFFPILTGQLEVEIQGQVVNSATFETVAKNLKNNPLSQELIAFIRGIDAARNGTPDIELGHQWPDDMERAIGEVNLKLLRERFTTSGSVIHIRAPLSLRRKDNSSKETYFDMFLSRAGEGVTGQSLFIRSTITVPGESRYFPPSDAFGALLASDDAIAEFLGDAENPAHTQWNGSGEKLKANWKNGGTRLHEIRTSLRALYKAIGQMEEYTDNDALVDFFSVENLEAGKKMPKKAAMKPPMPPLPISQKSYAIASRKGGFAVRPGGGLTQEGLPMTVKIRVAYDLLSGNALKKFDPLDFRLDQSPIVITSKGATSVTTAPNMLEVRATDLDFMVEVNGFDVNRDLLVDARKEQP